MSKQRSTTKSPSNQYGLPSTLPQTYSTTGIRYVLDRYVLVPQEPTQLTPHYSLLHKTGYLGLATSCSTPMPTGLADLHADQRRHFIQVHRHREALRDGRQKRRVIVRDSDIGIKREVEGWRG